MKKKTTTELRKEKEEMIIKYDKMIYDSMQEDGIRSRAEGMKLRAEMQELKDKGWYNREFRETPPEPEQDTADPTDIPPTIVAEIRKPEVDPKELEIAKLKEQLAVLETVAELAKEEEAIIVEEVIEEDPLSLDEMKEGEDYIKKGE